MKLSRVRSDRLPRITYTNQVIRRCVDVELRWVANRFQFLPAQRHRNRRLRPPAHAVGRDDGLILAIPIDVDQHLVLTRVFLYSKRRALRPLVNE